MFKIKIVALPLQWGILVIMIYLYTYCRFYKCIFFVVSFFYFQFQWIEWMITKLPKFFASKPFANKNNNVIFKKHILLSQTDNLLIIIINKSRVTKKHTN